MPERKPLQVDKTHLFWDTSLPLERRVDDLLARLTLEEKVAQLVSRAPAIERLGIPNYNWWNEGLHGVVAARRFPATVFPQAIGLAATWDCDLLKQVASAISDEARALHHERARFGEHSKGTGLTIWAPNVNIFRDPRWGRGQETYGEDPYLAGQLGVAYVQGLQGNHPQYLKVIATPKHFAVYSGPELLRHSFDARVSERDLRETYLPAFRACIQEGGARSIMCAYNRVNNEPCCASKTLLADILRGEWGFDGYVVADCGAVDDIYQHHGAARSIAQASAMATVAGCDLDCYWNDRGWLQALDGGLLSEDYVDLAVSRLFEARFRLGMFDPPEDVPYAQINANIRNCAAHKKLALRAARESIVLLKNSGGLLPLSKNIKSVAVIGPNADDASQAMLGNYAGIPRHTVTPLEGIRNLVGPTTQVYYSKGRRRIPRLNESQRDDEADLMQEAVDFAAQAEVVILCLGLSSGAYGVEGEENPNRSAPGFSGGDRNTLKLPSTQQELLRAVWETGTPVIVVLLNGGPLAINWADQHCAAILEAWYPGQAGGTAIAEVLFGDHNPSGRLPVTFYRSVQDLPPFDDYSMQGRTYRYFTGQILYPFGYGLSYTRFEYSALSIEPPEVISGEEVTIRARVRNVGELAGSEVVQLYLTDVEASVPVPSRSLKCFRKIFLQPGEIQEVIMKVPPSQMSILDSKMRRTVEPGWFQLSVGGGQPIPATMDGASTSQVVTGMFEVLDDS